MFDLYGRLYMFHIVSLYIYTYIYNTVFEKSHNYIHIITCLHTLSSILSYLPAIKYHIQNTMHYI